jgi:DNA mismatch repair protein MutS2
MIAELPSVEAALKRLDRILTPEGELSENATPELARIGSELRGLKREITQRMDSLVRDYHQKGVLQDQFTDVRDGRYVIPVRLSAQHEVPGLLHEASASRQTVFIEPREITELNNRLRQRQNDWLQEVHRLLSELSRDLSPQSFAWVIASQNLIHWDAVHARAAVAQKYEGLPLECDGSVLELFQTAHPLLWWTLPVETIQRNSIRLDASQRALLITGPNTGGKTVLLKTIGLAAAFGRTAQEKSPFSRRLRPI